MVPVVLEGRGVGLAGFGLNTHCLLRCCRRQRRKQQKQGPSFNVILAVYELKEIWFREEHTQILPPEMK